MDCILCYEKYYNFDYCYSCYKLICKDCYKKLDNCPFCRSSYSNFSELSKITILLNLIETKSPKIDIDIALYNLCRFESIKLHDDLQIFYLERSKYPSSYNQLGCIYWKKKEKEKAIENFKKGVEKKEPISMLNLAEEYFKNKDSEEAMKLLLEVEDKYLSENLISDKNFYLGILHYEKGNFRESKLCLESTDDGDERKFIYLNKIYHNEGNYELAMYNIKLTKNEKLISEYMPYDKLKRIYDNAGEESNSKKIKLINEILEE